MFAEKKKKKIKQCVCACVCVCSKCLCVLPYVCVNGSPLSGGDKRQKCVWALSTSCGSATPPTPPHTVGSNAWPGLYTIHKDHCVGEKWSHYFQAIMGYTVYVVWPWVWWVCMSESHTVHDMFSPKRYLSESQLKGMRKVCYSCSYRTNYTLPSVCMNVRLQI